MTSAVSRRPPRLKMCRAEACQAMGCEALGGARRGPAGHRLRQHQRRWPRHAGADLLPRPVRHGALGDARRPIVVGDGSMRKARRYLDELRRGRRRMTAHLSSRGMRPPWPSAPTRSPQRSPATRRGAWTRRRDRPHRLARHAVAGAAGRGRESTACATASGRSTPETSAALVEGRPSRRRGCRLNRDLARPGREDRLPQRRRRA